MREATEEDRENFIISRMISDFAENAAELAGKYGEFSSVNVYTALSILICKLAVFEGMSAHTLMEGILHTYRKFEEEIGAKQ
jgi:hypothetical protein